MFTNVKYLARTAAVSTVVVAAAALPAYACKTTPTPTPKPVVDKIGICHATGSKTNPYVFITVDKQAEAAHKNHQGDIIGVKSADKCPKPTVTPTPKPTTTPTPKPTTTPTPKPTTTPTPGKGGDTGKTLGTSTTPTPTPAPKSQPAPSELPQTGAGLSTLLGLPAMALAGRAYLASRRTR